MNSEPATAASAAPMTNVRAMVRSTSTPSNAAIFASCSQARWARPSDVFCTRNPERGQQDGGDGDDHDLLVGQGDVIGAAMGELNRLAEHRGNGLVVRPLRDIDEVGEKIRHADGRDQRREAERPAQPAVGDAFDDVVPQRGDGHAGDERQHHRQGQRGDAEKLGEREKHQESNEADSMNTSPWAKLTMPMMPNTIV